MSETSRRRFIGVTGAGAAAVSATALVPGSAFASQTHRRSDSATSPVVAYVRDVDSDEVTLMVDEREVVVHDRDLVHRLLNAAEGLTMSSHREAPEISKDPVADNTDVYAFVSPNHPTYVTLIANFIPLQKPDGGPNFYEFGDDVALRDQDLQQGHRQGRRRLPVPLPHQDPQQEDVPLQHRPDQQPHRRQLEPAAVLLGDPGQERPARKVLGREPALPAGQRRPAQHAGLRGDLAGQAVHTLGQPHGLRRPAGRRASTSTSAASSTWARCARSTRRT